MTEHIIKKAIKETDDARRSLQNIYSDIMHKRRQGNAKAVDIEIGHLVALSRQLDTAYYELRERQKASNLITSSQKYTGKEYA